MDSTDQCLTSRPVHWHQLVKTYWSSTRPHFEIFLKLPTHARKLENFRSAMCSLPPLHLALLCSSLRKYINSQKSIYTCLGQ